jgi:hypothetical protein
LHVGRQRSAHANLDELRQRGAAECAKARELEAGLEAAKLDVETAAAGVTDAHTVEDAKLIAQRRKDLEAAEAQVLDLQHRVGGAEIRVERARRDLDDFQRGRARDLLDEREAEARKLALDLTRAGQEAVRLHRSFVAIRMEVDKLVGTIPSAVPRSDGAPASHPWEREMHDLDLAMRETAEVPAPLPRWAGLEDGRRQDNANRLVKLARRKRLTADEQAEFDRLSQGRAVTPPVATLKRGGLITTLHGDLRRAVELGPAVPRRCRGAVAD